MATVNKTALVEFISNYNFTSEQQTKKVSAEFLEDFLTLISDAIKSGDEVSIAGFGKFYKFEKTKDGKGTGVYTPKFKPFKDLKDQVA